MSILKISLFFSPLTTMRDRDTLLYYLRDRRRTVYSRDHHPRSGLSTPRNLNLGDRTRLRGDRTRRAFSVPFDRLITNFKFDLTSLANSHALRLSTLTIYRSILARKQLKEHLVSRVSNSVSSVGGQVREIVFLGV